MHACIHTYIHTYIHSYTHVHIHTCVYVYIYIYMSVYTYIYIYMCTYTHILIYSYNMYTHTYIYIYIHTYICMYMYVYIYIYHVVPGAGGVHPREEPQGDRPLARLLAGAHGDAVAHLGRRYLSNATCPTRPRLCYALFTVSSTTIICQNIYQL